MTMLDDSIVQLIAEMQAFEALQDVIQNILDEHFSEDATERLLKPLVPGAESSRRLSLLPESKERKRKVIVEEFDYILLSNRPGQPRTTGGIF